MSVAPVLSISPAFIRKHDGTLGIDSKVHRVIIEHLKHTPEINSKALIRDLAMFANWFPTDIEEELTSRGFKEIKRPEIRKPENRLWGFYQKNSETLVQRIEISEEGVELASRPIGSERSGCLDIDTEHYIRMDSHGNVDHSEVLGEVESALLKEDKENTRAAIVIDMTLNRDLLDRMAQGNLNFSKNMIKNFSSLVITGIEQNHRGFENKSRTLLASQEREFPAKFFHNNSSKGIWVLRNGPENAQYASYGEIIEDFSRTVLVNRHGNLIQSLSMTFNLKQHKTVFYANILEKLEMKGANQEAALY